ncbi:MAG: Imm21 family immunity protein [Bradymonadaceae bacterium]
MSPSESTLLDDLDRFGERHGIEIPELLRRIVRDAAREPNVASALDDLWMEPSIDVDLERLRHRPLDPCLRTLSDPQFDFLAYYDYPPADERFPVVRYDFEHETARWLGASFEEAFAAVCHSRSREAEAVEYLRERFGLSTDFAKPVGSAPAWLRTIYGVDEDVPVPEKAEGAVERERALMARYMAIRWGTLHPGDEVATLWQDRDELVAERRGKRRLELAQRLFEVYGELGWDRHRDAIEAIEELGSDAVARRLAEPDVSETEHPPVPAREPDPETLGDCSAFGGDAAEALAHYREASEQGDADERRWKCLAKAAQALVDLDESSRACEFGERAVEESDGDPFARWVYGHALWAKDRPFAGKSQYEQAAEAGFEPAIRELEDDDTDEGDGGLPESHRDLTWVEPSEGPLLFAPIDVLDAWEGREGPDFERASEIGGAGLLEVGDQQVLVLNFEQMLTGCFVKNDGRIFFIRRYWDQSERSVMETFRQSTDSSIWERKLDPVTWSTPGQTYRLFDAAKSGAESTSGIYIDVDLEADTYEFRYRPEYTGMRNLEALRLRPEAG